MCVRVCVRYVALRIQLSEKTATALMKTKEFIMDKRGEIEVKVCLFLATLIIIMQSVE